MDEFIRSLHEGAEHFVVIYIDDLCIMTKKFEDHFKWIEIALKGIKKYNIQINLD